MNEKLKKAQSLFYKKKYKAAYELFSEINETYSMGVCSLLLGDLPSARLFFKIKEDECIASNFGLVVLNVLEGDFNKIPTYFQVRCFLEVFLNLFIENKMYDFAQKLIDNYGFFSNTNYETPKFIARVLNANGFDNYVHFFADRAVEICMYDAEIYYINSLVYIKENNYKEAKKWIDKCTSFAPEYYPILKLREKVEKF